MPPKKGAESARPKAAKGLLQPFTAGQVDQVQLGKNHLVTTRWVVV